MSVTVEFISPCRDKQTCKNSTYFTIVTGILLFMLIWGVLHLHYHTNDHTNDQTNVQAAIIYITMIVLGVIGIIPASINIIALLYVIFDKFLDFCYNICISCYNSCISCCDYYTMSTIITRLKRQQNYNELA
jgi:hypothetical protein